MGSTLRPGPCILIVLYVGFIFISRSRRVQSNFIRVVYLPATPFPLEALPLGSGFLARRGGLKIVPIDGGFLLCGGGFGVGRVCRHSLGEVVSVEGLVSPEAFSLGATVLFSHLSVLLSITCGGVLMVDQDG